MKSVGKNLGYQTLYQVLSTCLPLITAPYLSRVLGAEPLGIFSYTQSIVNYFLLVAMLGVVNYGTRTIAACNGNKAQVSENFWSIYIFQAFISLGAIVVYGFYLLQYCDENRLIALVQGFYLLGAFLDINWLFFGVENFKITVTRNTIIKIFTVILILLVVKSPDDLWLYTLIMAAGTFLSQAVLWMFLPGTIDFKAIKKVRVKNIVYHIKPNLVLFIPIAAMSVFRTMDKTMLGYFSNYYETGYYYNSDKIINIPLSIINGVGTVMLPRMSAIESSGDVREGNRIFNLSVEGIVLVSSAMVFGIAAVAKEFVPVFFGKGYEPCVFLTILFAPVLIFKALSQTVRMEYLIPKHKEKIYIYAVCAGAVSNFIANYILIVKYGALGAVIGTLIAEFVVTITQFWFIRKEIQMQQCIKNCWGYLLCGAIMFGVVRMSSTIFENIYVSLMTELVIGVLVYILTCIFYWNISNNMSFLKIIKYKKR